MIPETFRRKSTGIIDDGEQRTEDGRQKAGGREQRAVNAPPRCAQTGRPSPPHSFPKKKKKERIISPEMPFFIEGFFIVKLTNGDRRIRF